MSNSYVVVVGQQEHFVDKIADGILPLHIAEQAIKQMGLRSARKNPEKVLAEVYHLCVEKGAIKKLFINSYMIQPPLAEMTHEEFIEEMEETLSALPKEFHRCVREFLNNEDNSCRYEETLSSARNLVFRLKPAILEYTSNVKRGLT